MQETIKLLSLNQKAGWGLADMGIVVFVIVKQLLVLSFMTNYLGVPVAVAGMVTTGVLLFDILTDPLIGYLSDRTNTQWGRRAPWMFVGALILAAGTVGLFGVPEALNLTNRILWVSGFFILATIGFTMVSIPYGATAGEMTQNSKERSAMMGFRMAFASIGILLGGAVIPQIAGGTREGHLTAAISIAPIMVLAIWTSIWLTRKTPRVLEPSRESLWETASLVWRNTTFMILVILYGIMTLAIALITAGLPFAAMYLIKDNGETLLSSVASGVGILSLMFAAFVLGSILSQAIWVWASAKLGKTWALISGLILYIILLFVIYCALPSTNVTVIAGLFMLAGVTNGAYQQIPWAMYPDLMDITRIETGAAIEGAFSSIWLFGQKFANALAPSLLALILSIYGWLETTQGIVEQSPEAINALHLSITIVPSVILAFAILGLIFFYLRSLSGTTANS